jgi:hypothetical protein
MKIDVKNLMNEKKELVSVSLLGLIILLALLLLLKVTRFYAASARAQNVVVKAIDNLNSLPTPVDLSIDQKIVEALTSNNIFNAIPPSAIASIPQNPITEIRAIVGESVLINENWYKAGDSVNQVKIVAVEPTQVTIEFNNTQTTLRTIDASLPEIQQGARGSGTTNQIASNRGSMVTIGGTQRGFVGGLQNMSQAEVQRLRDQMGNMMGGMMGNRGGGMGGGMGGGRGGGMGGGRGGMGGGRGGRGG